MDTNLLAAEDVSIACDHPEGVTLRCEADGAQQQISVEVDASSFARWALRLPAGGLPLTGSEVLGLDLYVEGELDLNLYFVEEDGRRIYQRLPRGDLQANGQTLYFPLREIYDETGTLVDADSLRELQIVFEWADMAGSLILDGVHFYTIWEDNVAVPFSPEELSVPDGFVIEPIAADLLTITQIQVISAGNLLASTQQGRVWWYRDLDGDGIYESRILYASGFAEAVGLLYDPVDGAVWIGGHGRLWRTLDTTGDGIADLRELRFEGLPWGRHQNNGLAWNPVDDPFTGEPAYSWIYFGLGSVDDLEAGGEFSASILRFPRDGTRLDDLEMVAEGVRNAYGLIWAPIPHGDGVDWALFAGENGPDFHYAPDEVNHIRWGHHYGFPDQFGNADPEAEGDPYSSPVYEVVPHASANSLAYIDNPDWPEDYRTLYVSLFGSVFSPEPVGQTVDRIQLFPVDTFDGVTYRGEPSLFVDGLSRPLPLATDVNGDLLIGDYATGIIYRVRYVGESS
ncbi:MAG: hypothetical protein KF893_11545 [Caldilineaceae bacterium]|nr:hypothetical protein [Caldilineaceae bacterium]